MKRMLCLPCCTIGVALSWGLLSADVGRPPAGDGVKLSRIDPAPATVGASANHASASQHPEVIQPIASSLPPIISVSPDSLWDSLFTGESSIHTLNIANHGTSDLVFEITIRETTSPGAALTGEDVVASLVARSGIQDGDLRIQGVQAQSGERIQRVLSSPAEVAGVVRSNAAPWSGPSVAILAADDPAWVSDVQSKLLATGKFASVGFINIAVLTPTLEELNIFDAVLVWSDYSIYDPGALGDTLAEYVDGGGGVVCAELVMYTNPFSLGGRWESESYYIIPQSSYLCCDYQSLGAVTIPSHPIMAGVFSFDGGYGSYRPSTTSLTEGSTLVASWSDGMPLVAVKTIGSGRRVDLGFFPPSSDVAWDFWQAGTDGDLLLANALTWASFAWVSAEPVSDTIPAGDNLDITVTFRATGLISGDFDANLIISTNDSLSPTDTVPAHLHVTGAPDIRASDTLLDFGVRFIGAVIPETLTVFNEGTDLLTVSDVSSSPSDEFSVDVTSFTLNPGEHQDLIVTFAPSTTGAITGDLTFTSNDPDESVLVLQMRGAGLEPPVMSVSPDSLRDSLFTGDSSLQALTISNNGMSDLVFGIAFEEVALPARVLTVEEAVSSLFSRSGIRDGTLRVDTTGAVSGERVEETVSRSEDVVGVVRPATAMAAGRDVAVVAAAYSDALSDVQSKLLATGQFGSVTSINVAFLTPSLAELQAFDAILVWSDQYWGYAYFNAVALGDTLAAYVDGGGGVVSALWESAGDSYYHLGGRWESEGYNVIARGGYLYGQAFLGPVAIPSHRIMAGVFSFDGGDGSYRPSTTSLTAGSTLIASWSDGSPLVAVKTMGSGRRADLGFFPVSSDLSSDLWQAGTDGDLLMANALTWASFSWLSAEPVWDTVGVGGSQDVAFTFRAVGLNGGDYYTNIVISSNDPVTHRVDVPAHLHVTGAPNLVLSDTLFDYGNQFIGALVPETLTVSNQGTDLLTVSDVSSSPSEFSVDVTSFSLNPDEQQVVVVSFAPSATGLISGSLTLTSNDPDEPMLIVLLQGAGLEPPVISVSPDSLRDSLLSGEHSTHILTIQNTGVADLMWDATATDVDSVTVLESSPVFASPGPPPTGKVHADQPSSSRSRAEHHVMGTSEQMRAPRAAPAMEGAVLIQDKPSLEQALAALDSNSVSINSMIPNRYDFSEGTSGTFISDGGNDMYDGGNGLFTELGGPLAYSDGLISNSSSLGPDGRYFTRKYPGLFVFVADLQSVQEFSITGNVGADGSGAVDGAVLQASVNHRSYHGFVKRIFNAFDPSVNHLIIVEDGVAAGHEFSTNTDNDFHRVFNLAGSQRIYYLLYAGASGSYIDNTATLGIMTAFLNALPLGPKWLSPLPGSGTIPAGGSMDLEVTLDATGLFGGEYDAKLVISSNDPITPELAIPAHLHVTGVPDIALSEMLFDYGTRFIGTVTPETLTVSNFGTDLLTVSDISSDQSDYSHDVTSFSLNPGEQQNVVVNFVPSTTGAIIGNLTLASNDHDELVLIVHLQGAGLAAPVLHAAPDSLGDSLFMGETSIQTLTISNHGFSDLVFDISFGAAPAPATERAVDLAVSSLIVQSGILEGNLVAAATQALSGERVEAVVSKPEEVANVVQAATAPTSGPDVAIVAASNSLFLTDVRSKLLATGKFGSVSTINVAYVTPGLAQLQAFDGVLVWSDQYSGYTYLNTVDLGDHLADYVDGGGGVVCALWEAAGDYPHRLSGRWESQAYYAMGRGNYLAGYRVLLGAVADPGHPIMAGVGSFDGGSSSYRPIANFFSLGTTLIARWSDGKPLVVTKVNKTGRRVDLGFFPPSSDVNPNLWQAGTDGGLIMANALVWAASPAWLTSDPEHDTIPAGGSRDVDILIRAYGLTSGDHDATVVISSNDPLSPQVSLPLHVNVAEALWGDYNVNGSVNGSDIVYLVNYVFRGGPEPRGQTGDLNCDQGVTVADLITMVNYVFRGGTLPTCH